ncbi:MAG: YbjN domain-containing protein [Microcystaceae cyanobacterium]
MISSHLEAIETVIGGMAQNDSAMVQNIGSFSLWKFQYGSIEVFVQLTGEEEENLFTVWAGVLTLPARDELGLFRHLLTLNWDTTIETCFAIKDDQIVVLCQRTVEDLSPGEISRAITLVAAIADDHDEILKEKFGGQ